MVAQYVSIPYQTLDLSPIWENEKVNQDTWVVGAIDPVQSKTKRSPEDTKELTEKQPSGDYGVQNNIDALWTWSINGAKLAGSLVLLTGAVKIVQGVLKYWRDEVIVWWNRMKRRWATLSTDEVSSDDE